MNKCIIKIEKGKTLNGRPKNIDYIEITAILTGGRLFHALRKNYKKYKYIK
mgnify:FL=1